MNAVQVVRRGPHTQTGQALLGWEATGNCRRVCGDVHTIELRPNDRDGLAQDSLAVEPGREVDADRAVVVDRADGAGHLQ